MSNESAIRREVGAIALMFTGLGSIIGSGWLFGAWRAAQLAGPGAIYAWIIGAVVILFVAFTYAELGRHVSGVRRRGALRPLFAWLAGGIRRRLGGLDRHRLGDPGGGRGIGAVHEFLAVGLGAAAVCARRQWSGRVDRGRAVDFRGAGGDLFPGQFLEREGVRRHQQRDHLLQADRAGGHRGCDDVSRGFHWENFHVGIHGGQHVGNVAAILTAVATSGIVFSFNGFQSPVNLAGEARNPGRSVPFAIFGSIALSTVVYLLLQVAFLGAVAPEHLHEGWAGLEYSSPFAQLALALNLNWLAILLYADAFVSPSGTGTTYTATTARMIYAMERSGTVPAIFGRVHPRYGIPRPAMWFNLVVSFIFLFFFRGWGKLAAVISVATIITYLVVPISVMVLQAHGAQPASAAAGAGSAGAGAAGFRARHADAVLGPLAAHRRDHAAVDSADAGLSLLPTQRGLAAFVRPLRASWWLLAYLLTITALSWAGSKEFEGHDYIGYGWDQLCVAVAALFFYFWGVRSGWRTPGIDALESGAKNT